MVRKVKREPQLQRSCPRGLGCTEGVCDVLLKAGDGPTSCPVWDWALLLPRALCCVVGELRLRTGASGQRREWPAQDNLHLTRIPALLLFLALVSQRSLSHLILSPNLNVKL